MEETTLEPIGMRQSYPWGTRDATPTLLGRLANNQSWAEWRFGAHPLGDSPTSDGLALSEYLAQDPNRLNRASVMTFGRRLPFLMKVLSATSPLNLQAHPTRRQTRDGHARKPLMGIPLGAPKRSFEGDWPKPGTIVALTPFEVLVDFRDPLLTIQLPEALEVGDVLALVIGLLRDRISSPALQEVLPDILSLDDRRHLADEALGAAINHPGAPGKLGVFTRTAVEIDECLPSDPGIPTALLLNRFPLEPGRALALPPGVMHSYLRDTCIEMMTNSDNVLRGDLVNKCIDVDAPLHVADFTPDPGDVLLPSGSDGTYIYPTGSEEFELWLLQPTDGDTLQVLRRDSGRICLVASRSLELTGNSDPVVLKPGYAVFVAAEGTVMVRGEGQLFMVVTGI